jgi:hypothetical protein
MSDPEKTPRKRIEQDDIALWILVGCLALIVVGGLVYGFSNPSIYTTNPPQTAGSAAQHARSGHPM